MCAPLLSFANTCCANQVVMLTVQPFDSLAGMRYNPHVIDLASSKSCKATHNSWRSHAATQPHNAV